MRRAVAAALLLLVVTASAETEARPPTPYAAYQAEQFAPIVLGDAASPSPPVHVDGRALLPPRPSARPTPSTPEPTPKVQPKSTSIPAKVAPSGGTSIRGLATWYCKAGRSVCHRSYPDRPGMTDMYAAAGSEIRLAGWRGKRVGVCRTDGRKCITVTLVDWCACKGNRIIDLYWDAFDALNVGGETGGISVRVIFGA